MFVTEEDLMTDEGPRKITVSKAGGFSAEEYPIDESLTGGGRQVQFVQFLSIEDRWLPLGEISKLDGEEFRDRYQEADREDSDTEFADGMCTGEIYSDYVSEDTDEDEDSAD